MRYTLNGKQVTKEEAYNEIRKMIPNGGTQYLDNLIRDSRENGIEKVTLRVGNKGTMTIEI